MRSRNLHGGGGGYTLIIKGGAETYFPSAADQRKLIKRVARRQYQKKRTRRSCSRRSRHCANTPALARKAGQSGGLGDRSLPREPRQKKTLQKGNKSIKNKSKKAVRSIREKTFENMSKLCTKTLPKMILWSYFSHFYWFLCRFGSLHVPTDSPRTHIFLFWGAISYFVHNSALIFG